MKFETLQDPYSNGLLKATNQMIVYVEGRIEQLKDRKFEENSPRQISTYATRKTYLSMLHKLKQRKDSIIKNQK